MTRIDPCLWFDGDKAEAAATFYVSLLAGSRIESVMRAPVDTPTTPAGAVLALSFTLAGNRFMALNGNTRFPFTPAVSFSIDCADQAEIDRLWAALLDGGGAPMACGWLTDQFGVAWQIVPDRLVAMMGDSDPARAARVATAMMGMIKLDIAALDRAYTGER